MQFLNSLINNFRANKYVGTFFSTAAIGGGQETTALSCLPFFTHMGMTYVSFGTKFMKYDPNQVHGGSGK